VRRHTDSRAALGTTFRVTIYASDPRVASSAMSAAFERLSRVDAALGDGLEALNRSPERRPVKVADDLFAVLQHAQKFSAATRGAFDLTRGPYVELWRKAAAAGRAPTQAEIEDARLRVGWDKLRLDSIERTATLTVPGMGLDLQGIARGYALDTMMQQLRLHGCDASKVEAGDVQFLGAPPPGRQWNVPLRATAGPKGPRSMPADRAAIAYAGAGKRREPPVDPATGRTVVAPPPLLAVARSAAAAECVATAAVVLGPAGTDLLTRAEPGAKVRFGPAGPRR
jgi:FAD:protein FMN transferase